MAWTDVKSLTRHVDLRQSESLKLLWTLTNVIAVRTHQMINWMLNHWKPSATYNIDMPTEELGKRLWLLRLRQILLSTSQTSKTIVKNTKVIVIITTVIGLLASCKAIETMSTDLSQVDKTDRKNAWSTETIQKVACQRQDMTNWRCQNEHGRTDSNVSDEVTQTQAS